MLLWSWKQLVSALKKPKPPTGRDSRQHWRRIALTVNRVCLQNWYINIIDLLLSRRELCQIKLLIPLPGFSCQELLATDIHCQYKGPVRKTFWNFFRSWPLVHKICNDLSTLGFILEGQTLVSLFLLTAEHQILLHHAYQSGGTGSVWYRTTQPP